ncbi:hypothetical protein M2375_002885 [Comamonas sp. BIGb0152]|nr:hypothetical protein [Comamonas sp. BIGb0152]
MLAFFTPVRDPLHNHRPMGWTLIARDRVQAKVCAMYCASSP